MYVDIFLGKIKRRDDLRIKRINPDLHLPNSDIALVVRLDGSGTTYALGNHLSAISDEWRDRGPGVGTLLDWPGNAMAARGNKGVAGRIRISKGSIGYVEQYDDAHKLAALKQFAKWCLTTGQEFNESLAFVRLPPPVITRAIPALDRIR